MNRLLVAVVCVMSLAGTAMGQSVANFGSRTGGLGNAGGFATGSGFSNGSAESLFLGRSAGVGFGNTTGLYTGGNAASNYGAYGFNGGNAYWGSNDIGSLNTAGLGVPGLGVPGLGLGTGGLGVGGLDGMFSSGMGWGGPGWYSGGVGGGLLPGTGLDATGMGVGVPGLNYGVPMTAYGLSSPTVPNATSGLAPTRNRRTENYTNNAIPNRADAFAAGVPMVTANALRIQDRIARSVSRANFRNIKVLMAGRTAVLQGSVDSQADEQLVRGLVSLEPSVDGVISQLDYPGKAQTATVTAR